jgi:Cu/Ag efflux pump CusA
MTLGGLTIAIGALVDDAIIDVENVFRRLPREPRPPEARRPLAEVVYEASREIRGSIVFATADHRAGVRAAVLPDRRRGPDARAARLRYLVALFASLVVALTLTPALCAYALPPRPAPRSTARAVVSRC